MNKVENLTRPRVSSPEDQSLFIQKGKQNQAELMKLQLSQALLQILASNTSTPTGSSIGTSTSALTAGSTFTTLPNVVNMPFLKQQGNACGTTTLAEIMTYLGVPMTQADVDKGIRRLNTFTAPDDMIEFARDHGLEAEGYNHGSWEEVKSMIDAGYPVQAMVGGDDSVAVNRGTGTFSVDGLHYIAITGYRTDEVTGEEFVIYHDPNRTTEQEISVGDFEKMWGDVPGGFDNYFVAYGPKGADLPPGRDDGIESTLGVLNGVTNLTNGLDRIFCPDSFGGFLHGIAEVYGGVFQTVGSFVGGLFQLGAGWLNHAVEGIPVLENFVQPFGDIVNGFGAVIADVFNGFGEACDSVGGAFESLFDGDVGGFFEGLGDAVGDFAGGVVDAVGDAVDAVGDAVSDFFSGW